jgi:hypothetical protein
MLFMEKQGYCEVTDLLLRVLVRGYQIDSFKVTEIDVVTLDIDV